MRQIIFLGTGTSTGVPEIGCQCATCTSSDSRDKRLRTSAYIRYDDVRLLIDCGPDFRAQMLRSNIDAVDAIFLTHEHYDHVGGIDDIRPIFRQDKSCPIYAEPNVIEALRTRMPYAFTDNPYPGVPKIDLNPIYPQVPIVVGVLEIMPLRVMHGRLPIVGFKVGSLGYVTDCKTLPDETINALYGIDTLALNALRLYEHPAHLDLEEALALIERIEPRKSYLLHFAHTFGTHTQISKMLPENVFAAYDTLTVEL